MIEDRELWACANLLVQQHGDGARAHADNRIAALFADSDHKGVATWQAIATRIEQLGVMTCKEPLN
jgi:hypothetical protein